MAWVSASEAGPSPRSVSDVRSGAEPSSSRPQSVGKLRFGSTPSSLSMTPSVSLGRRFGERVLVAVRVRHAEEPQLAGVHEQRHLLVVAVLAREVVERVLAG